MTTKRSAETCTYRVDRSSLVAIDRSLVVDGAGEYKDCSIHLNFAPCGRYSVEIFHCCDDDCEILAINGELDSKLLVPLITEVIERGTITLSARDTDDDEPRRPRAPQTREALGSTTTP